MSHETGMLLCFAAGALSGVVVCLLHPLLRVRDTAGSGALRFFVLSAAALSIGWTLPMFQSSLGMKLPQLLLSATAGLSLSALLIAWGKVLFTRRDRSGDLCTGAAVGTVTGLVPLPSVFVLMVGAPLAGAVSAFAAGTAAMRVRRSYRGGVLGTGLGVAVGCLVGAVALLVTLPLTTFTLLYLSDMASP